MDEKCKFLAKKDVNVKFFYQKLFLKIFQVKYRKAGPGRSPLGTLCVFDDRVEWTSDGDASDQLLVPFAKVKGLQEKI